MALRTERFTGVLVSWKDDKGYGFIEPSVGGRQVFVHVRALQHSAQHPPVGESVSYEIEVTPDGKRRAAHVTWAQQPVAGGSGSRHPGSGHPGSGHPGAGHPSSSRQAASPAGGPHRPAASRGRSMLTSRSSIIDYVVILAFLALYLIVALVWQLPAWVAAIYVVASVLCILVYAADKSAAVEGRWRVSESALLALGLVGGWPGAIVAQRILRHKTKKVQFRIAFWGSVLLNIAAFVAFSSFYYEHVLTPGQ
jgi:uncharacterized membrane protein YsdA (DUF1294 family)/cold shock CspA family protein